MKLPFANPLLLLERYTRTNRLRRALGACIRRYFPNFRLFRALASRFGRTVLVPLPWGGGLFVDLRDKSLARTLFGGEVWEPGEVALLQRLLKPGMTFMDIGANFGYYTVLAGHLVGHEGRVVAFEPDTRNAELLEKNVRHHGFPMVHLERRAVSDSPGTMTLYTSPLNLGAHKVFTPSKEDVLFSGGAARAVSATTLDIYCREKHIRPDVVKMDVEGGEHAVLCGMREVIAQCPNIIIIAELFSQALRGAGTSAEAFLAEARAMGFRVYELRGTACVEVADTDVLGNPPRDVYTNVVLTKKPL